MADMRVRLYALPEKNSSNLTIKGIDIRRPIAPEKHIVIDWSQKHFSKVWTSECDVAFSRSPISCFIAVKD